MLPRIELLKIALAHAKSGATFLRNKQGCAVYRLGYKTELIGLFIPASSYYTTDGIESLITWQLLYAGLINKDEMEFINAMDKINMLDDALWVETIQRKIDDELKTGD